MAQRVDDESVGDDDPTIYSTNEAVPEDAQPVVGVTWYDGDRCACTEPDAALIAEARTDLPEALRLLDRCEAALKTMRAYAVTVAVVSQGSDGSATVMLGELDALLRDLGGDGG